MKNSHINHIKKQNPAIAKAKFEANIERKLQETHINAVRYANIARDIIDYIVLFDKIDLSKEQIKEFKNYINEIADTLNGKYASIEDMIKVCQDEIGTKFTKEDLCIIDPKYKAYITDDVNTLI